MTLKALGPDAATQGRAARDSAAAAGTGAAAHAHAAPTGSPGGTGNGASSPGGQQASAAAAGAAGTGAAAHAQATHTGNPDGTGNRASAHGGQQAPADAAGSAEAATSADAPPAARPQAEAGAAAPDATMALRAVRPDGAAPGGTASDDDRTSVLPTPLAPGTAQPNVDDLGLFDDATRPLRAVSAGAPVPRPEAAAPHSRGSRRRRGALIAASGAVVAVLGAAGWASGLFSYETPSRDTAAPDDVRASVPDASSEEPAAEPSSEAPSASPSASASESPSASASGSASPSASASAPSASATASAEPSATPSPGAASSAPAVAPEPEEPVDTAPVLRRGDRGPEVVELQQRLRQVWLYQGDADGRYSRRVEEAVRHYQWQRGINEELGVYGPQTRARLESETRTP
ncbi:peptidoglycan-binding domain-containing protein [Streptomyces cellulosae]